MVYCWLLLLASFSSKSYEQQYYVGDTGPNGGTVTSVTLQSVLSDSTTKLVGDFEETIDTYIYTETVIEDVTSTQEVTTTTYETVEETTSDLINSTTLTNGTTTCATQGTGVYVDNCAYHVKTWDDGHISTDGGFQFETDLDNYLTEDEIKYGFDVRAGNNVYSATGSGTFSITLKVVDPNSGEDYQSTQSWLLSSGWNNTPRLTLSVPENTLSIDSVLYSTFYGVDSGGYQWSMTPTNFNVWIDYYSITEVLSTIEQTIISQIETSINTTEYETQSIYIPPVDDFMYEVDTVDVLAEFTIELDTFDDVLTMDFEIVEMDTGEMQMEITTFENDMEIDVEIVELDMESMVEEMDVQVAEVQSDSEDTPEPTMEAEEEGEQETVQPKDTKETIAAKILEKVAEQGDQIALSNVKLAVMAQLTDTQEFNNYQAKVIEDMNVDQYLTKTIEDNYGILFSTAQDQLMEQMVNSQYGRN